MPSVVEAWVAFDSPLPMEVHRRVARIVGRLIVREWNARLYLELVAEAVAVGVAAVRRPPGRARAVRPVLTDGPAPRPEHGPDAPG
jgi:hypothetical protein